MLRSLIFLVLFTILVPFTKCKPAYLSSNNREDSGYSVEYERNRTQCDAMDVFQWSSEFHECFIDRKYSDGGRDLNNIIDRILEHSEACVEISRRDCQPDFHGFKVILNKVLEQMKDYSVMYLESILKGREDIKDLKCVEETVSLQTYETCFETLISNPILNEDILQKVVKEGLSCANERNRGCSREAKTTLNRIVRVLFGVEQPTEEDVEDEIPTPTTPPPMMWYDYIFQPFISAWYAIKSFFG